MLLIVKRLCGLGYGSWRRGNGLAHAELVVRDRACVQAPARDERGARLKNEAMQRTEQLLAALDSDSRRVRTLDVWSSVPMIGVAHYYTFPVFIRVRVFVG
jgi:hypothetical protein